MVAHLPKFGGQSEEPCENYEDQSDILETPIILMPELWGKPIEIAKNWLRRFRMEGGTKNT